MSKKSKNEREMLEKARESKKSKEKLEKARIWQGKQK